MEWNKHARTVMVKVDGRLALFERILGECGLSVRETTYKMLVHRCITEVFGTTITFV